MQPTYSVFLMLSDGSQLKALPGGLSRTEAEQKCDAINAAFARFPGGTQSIRLWIELD